jgi:capsular polysaccharide biosynthesis protein
MEIRDYFRTIGRFIWWLIVPLIAVLLLSLILSLTYNVSYEAPVSFSINRKSQQAQTADYQYDSYYAIQANNLLAAQFTEWLKGAAVVPVIYARAGLKDESSLLQKEWKVEDHSPQDIEMIFRGRSKDRISTLARAALETVNEKKDEFTGGGDSSLGVVGIPSEVIVVTKNTSLPLNLLVGLLAGIIIGLIFVYFKAIFSPGEISNQK